MKKKPTKKPVYTDILRKCRRKTKSSASFIVFKELHNAFITVKTNQLSLYHCASLQLNAKLDAKMFLLL